MDSAALEMCPWHLTAREQGGKGERILHHCIYPLTSHLIPTMIGNKIQHLPWHKIQRLPNILCYVSLTFAPVSSHIPPSCWPPGCSLNAPCLLPPQSFCTVYMAWTVFAVDDHKSGSFFLFRPQLTCHPLREDFANRSPNLNCPSKHWDTSFYSTSLYF